MLTLKTINVVIYVIHSLYVFSFSLVTFYSWRISAVSRTKLQDLAASIYMSNHLALQEIMPAAVEC